MESPHPTLNAQRPFSIPLLCACGDPSFLLSPKCHSERSLGISPPHRNSPPPSTVRHSPPPHWPSPVGASLVGALPPILPIAAHHPIPSPVIPRLREESHRSTLNPLHPTPFTYPTSSPPHGRPSWAPSPPSYPLPRTILYLPLSFRGSARNLTGPRSTPLHPITVRHSHLPTHSSFPRRGAPRGRPPPHPTHCRAPSYTFP